MLIGQDRAGKTSLKKSFLGLPFDPEEESTEGIEVDPSKFEVGIDQVENWKRTDEKLGVSQFAADLAKMVAMELQEINDEAEEGGNVAKNDDENEYEAMLRDVTLFEVNPCRKKIAQGPAEFVEAIKPCGLSLQSQKARLLHFKNEIGFENRIVSTTNLSSGYIKRRRRGSVEVSLIPFIFLLS